MKKISSDLTFLNKRFYPVIVFIFAGIIVLFNLYLIIYEKRIDLSFISAPFFIGIIGYLLIKRLVLDLADEVWDDGGALLVKKGGESLRINFTDIKKVDYSYFTNQPRVTLRLNNNTIFGDTLSFMPPTNFLPYIKNRDIVELVDRIENLRKEQNDFTPKTMIKIVLIDFIKPIHLK